MTEARTRGERLHHVLFGVALVLLALLAAWWFVFLNLTVSAEHEREREKLLLEARLLASRLAVASKEPAALDRRQLEVVPATGAPEEVVIPGTSMAVQPTTRALEAMESELWRRRVMVFGEGALLLVLIGACTAMLYRLVLAERRYRRDVEHFLSRVTHEMKTPLAGLRALLQTLHEGRLPPDRLRGLVELGLRQADRGELLVENLLSAHRVAHRRAPMVRERIDVGRELRAFVRQREEALGTRAGRHVLDCPDGLSAEGSTRALVSVLENLTDNADKYGATRIEITAGRGEESSQAGETIVVRVADDGDGFPPAEAEDLFEAFHRGASHATSRRRGTGLGLYIARELAREMGGDLTAGSAGPGRGATFTLELPAASDASEAPAAADASGAASRARAEAS